LKLVPSFGSAGAMLTVTIGFEEPGGQIVFTYEKA
jgi:hypothetical protein